MSPEHVTRMLEGVVEVLGLNASMAVRLAYTKPSSFAPEPNNCHLNVWVHINATGGTHQCGWILSEDNAAGFAEAQFRTVWKSESGELFDVTPRGDGEELLLFIPDPTRQVTLVTHNGAPAIGSYENVRIHAQKIMTGIKEIIIVPQGDFMYRHGLVTSP